MEPLAAAAAAVLVAAPRRRRRGCRWPACRRRRCYARARTGLRSGWPRRRRDGARRWRCHIQSSPAARVSIGRGAAAGGREWRGAHAGCGPGCRELGPSAPSSCLPPAQGACVQGHACLQDSVPSPAHACRPRIHSSPHASRPAAAKLLRSARRVELSLPKAPGDWPADAAAPGRLLLPVDPAGAGGSPGAAADSCGGGGRYGDGPGSHV